MDDCEKTNIKITLTPEVEITLRALDSWKSDLSNYILSEMSTEQVAISHHSRTRSVDPIIIGTLSLAVIPIALEKLADLIIKWVELRKDCSVTLNLDVKGASPILITYNPKTTTEETLKKWITTAISSNISSPKSRKK